VMTPHGRFIKVLREFTFSARCSYCDKPNPIEGRWIRTTKVDFANEKVGNKLVDCEVKAPMCLWCQMRGMPNARLPPKYDIKREDVMAYYQDSMGPIVNEGFLRQ